MDDGLEVEDLVSDLVGRCVEAWGSDGAVEALLAEHPGLAAAARERLSKLQRAGLLASGAEDAPEVPERLGDFRLIRQLGSGGMGVVYLAEQVSLGREVALKLLRPELRFVGGARARFRREIEAIARLGDAGIVPIYAVGEDHGIDYFTMEYVRGASLGDVLATVQGGDPDRLQGRDIVAAVATRLGAPPPTERLPELFAGTWVQACSRIVARMARAAHHAHDRGVIHRDLKPNNAMVTLDGRVLLLDFGLAAAAGTSSITRSGALLGTLHYMAPEQLSDGEIGPHTDVYALGVTLYELLALAPPFQADESERLRHRILHADPAPLWDRRRAVPRDVATIVEVALNREVRRRFASADALADDLERFLRHEPIRARPAGWPTRVRRAAQRHPARSTAFVLTLLAALATPLLISLSRGDMGARLVGAEEQARASLRAAVEATSRMVEAARGGAMSRTPGLDSERLQQLGAAADLMTSLQRQNPRDAAVQALFVRGMVKVAEVRTLLGQTEPALRDLMSAEAVLDGLRAARPDDLELAQEAGSLRLVRATTYVGEGRFADATGEWQQMVEAFDGGDSTAPLPSKLVVQLSTCHNNLARMRRAEGDLPAAIRHLDRALALDARIAPAQRTLDQSLDSARSRMNLATLHLDRGELDQARSRYTEVADELRALAARHPDEPEVRRERARADFALAKVAAAAKEPEVAATLRASAIETQGALATAYPARVAYRHELGLMAFEASCDLQLAGDLDAARVWIERAITEHVSLLEQAPGHPEYGSELATFYRQRGGLLVAARRMDEALVEIERGIALQASITAAHPEDSHHQVQLAGLYQELGIYHWRMERWTDARDGLLRAAAAYEVAVAAHYAPALDPRRLPKLLAIIAQAELMCDDFDGVLRAVTRLQELHPMTAADLQTFGENLHVGERADFRALVEVARAKEASARTEAATAAPASDAK